MSDVKVTNYNEEEIEKPIAKKIVNEKKEEPKKEEFSFPTIDDEFFNDVEEKKELKKEKTIIENNFSKRNFQEEINEIPKPFVQEEIKDEDNTMLYQTSKEEEYVKKYTSNEYGNYGKMKDKKIFRPSPNISPVYGIIDENGDTINGEPRKEIRLNTSVRGERVNVDDIRQKAYGINIVEEPKEEIKEEVVSIDLKEEKPKVNKITMGDAEEYYEDLGLEYNNDYIDAKKEKNIEATKRVDKYSKEEQKEDINEFDIKEEKVKIKEEESIEEDNIDDDNLFDLIDSMYDK